MTGLGNVVQIARKSWISLPTAALLIAGTGALLLPNSASAAQVSSHERSTLTVSTKGSDTGNCQRHSCKTLGYALTQAHPNSSSRIRITGRKVPLRRSDQEYGCTAAAYPSD